ncbi:MAG TPA: hypothetical protein VEH04_20665 [Verrucomicrobiae bacterium]|nr:hypothetical protein [Verrucomicrobiae bacterium]
MITKTFVSRLGAAALLAASLTGAYAVPSEIQFVNTGNAPAFSGGPPYNVDLSGVNITVSHTTGAFSPIPLGHSADWTTGFSTGDSGFTLWQLIYNGVTFKLDGTSITLVNPGPGTLFLAGDGIVHINAHNAPGQWNLVIDTTGNRVSTFGAATTTDLPENAGRVPDAGMTFTLLAVGMSGLVLIRRRIS